MADSIWISVGTVLASGVTSTLVTYRLNRNKEQTFFMRKKAEELYLATDGFGRDLSGWMITFLPVIEGRMDYNQMLDLQNSNPPNKRHGGAETMEMLTRIYFPGLAPNLSELLQARSEFNTIKSAHKSAYLEGYGDDERFKPAFLSAIKRVDRAIEGFKEAIIVYARKHTEAERTLRS